MDKIGGERLHDAGRVRVITRQSRNLAISPCDQGANIPYLDGLDFKHSVFQTTAWIEILIRSSRKRAFDTVLHIVPFFQFIRQGIYCHFFITPCSLISVKCRGFYRPGVGFLCYRLVKFDADFFGIFFA